MKSGIIPRTFPPNESGAESQPLTVGDVFRWYQSNLVLQFSPAALKERRRLWSLFCERFGSKLVDECRAADLLAFIMERRGCKSSWSRRRIRATICKPFNEAAALGLIIRNPFLGLRLPMGKNGRDWTKEEYQTALRNSAPHFRRLIVFLRFSGARPGEARTLEWSQIRYDVKAIVQRTHKTDRVSEAPRRIHFNHVLVKLLAWLRRHKEHTTFVFVSKYGAPWTVRSLTNHMNIVRSRAGLPKNIRLHGCRHTFATSAILNGVDIATLAQLLGHRTIKTTERYLHLVDKQDYLNVAMEKAIGGTSPAAVPPAPAGQPHFSPATQTPTQEHVSSRPSSASEDSTDRDIESLLGNASRTRKGTL